MNDLSELDAAKAYAKAWNQLDAESLVDLISDEACYASQWVLDELEGKQAVLDHLRRKMRAVAASSITDSGNRPFAELVITQLGEPGRNAVGLTVPGSDQLDCMVLLGVSESKINRIDICMIELYAPKQSGNYPGRSSAE
ncbi:hypothetical protein SAMN05216296_2424 [Pseudomonas pohangensis]|uniref:SnoaL-like domain-containing protein n=1 Tax=Pseudomonas pohangensis TaxID=364197 RepID=A0A1H2GNW7_9PSED|nr:nuclear transport factor 2 family protein [Pseudomonas pohangensis]SDU21169.1 hypothetical protein SAMN05216296_2424 [Pseudomonas pohangensis]